MKLSQLKSAVAIEEEGVTVTIYDPLSNPYTASDGSDVTVTVVGLQTKARRDAQEEEDRRMKKIAQVDNDYITQRRGRLAAGCMLDWHGWETENGEPIEFTKDNVVAAITIDERVLFQVEQAIDRHASFFAKQKKS